MEMAERYKPENLAVPIDHNRQPCPYIPPQMPESGYAWVAYQPEEPYLPVAVADSARALAELVGVSIGFVVSAWSLYKNGKRKTSRFHRVAVGVET